MPVFKLSIQVIKKNLSSISIYFFIFIGITLLFATQNTQAQDEIFSDDKVDIAFISEENTPLIEGFKKELSQYANFVSIEDNKESLQDALFFRSVEYILRVPKGFTSSFLNGDSSIQLEKTTVPLSVSGKYLDITIDQYFNTARLYVNGIDDITQEQLVHNLHKDLSYRTPVEFQNVETAEDNHHFAMNYFNYLSYSIFSILILGMSTVIIVFNNNDIKKRNSCSPISSLRMNLEFLVFQMFYTVIAWLVMIICYFIFDKNSGITNHTWYFMLNSFVFTMCASSISFLVGNISKNRNSLSAITNVITLGPCFISGIFVPQDLLSPTVLKIASFTPTYWYAKANGIISSLTEFSGNQMKPIWNSILIQIGFSIAFLSLALVFKKKRSQES